MSRADGLTARYKKLNSSIQSLYSEIDCPRCNLSKQRDEKRPLYNFSVWEEAARHLHRSGAIFPEQLGEAPFTRAIQETNRLLSPAVDSIAHEVAPTTERSLREDVFLFSGFKTYHSLKEASSLLLDENGHIKPFNRFLNDIQKINENYNKRYLEAEYLFATQSAISAARWEEQIADGDHYNLQYRTAGDDRVREEHVALNRTTLPPSDPFWATCYPPNGWRCRCIAVQVRKSKYPQSNPVKAMEEGRRATEGRNNIFRFNPGQNKVIFPPKHPYYGRDGYQHCENPNLAVKVGGNEVCRVLRKLSELYENEISQPKELKETDRKIKEWSKNNRGVINSQYYKSGKLNISLESIKAYLGHARSTRAKWLLSEIIDKPQKMQFLRFDPLGDNKDMNNPKDLKNVERKQKRGVLGYNVYEIEFEGKAWRVGLEVINSKFGNYEQPYYVVKIRKKG